MDRHQPLRARRPFTEWLTIIWNELCHHWSSRVWSSVTDSLPVSCQATSQCQSLIVTTCTRPVVVCRCSSETVPYRCCCSLWVYIDVKIWCISVLHLPFMLFLDSAVFSHPMTSQHEPQMICLWNGWCIALFVTG